jgi:hypothetical protein
MSSMLIERRIHSKPPANIETDGSVVTRREPGEHYLCEHIMVVDYQRGARHRMKKGELVKANV